MLSNFKAKGQIFVSLCQPDLQKRGCSSPGCVALVLAGDSSAEGTGMSCSQLSQRVDAPAEKAARRFPHNNLQLGN